MTEQMKHFLTELAELMERYDVSEAEVTESSHGYMTSIDGVEFTIIGRWDESGEPVQEYCTAELPRFFDADTIRSTVEDEK